MTVQVETFWVDASGGYQVAYDAGKIICRNQKGNVLPSLPPGLERCRVVEELKQVSIMLREHEQACAESVEHWMLNALPVPTRVLTSVWEDPAWRRALENIVVAPMDFGDDDRWRIGLLRDADDDLRALEVVNASGESAPLDSQAIVIPHPLHLPELDGLRAVARDRGLDQRIAQLYREVFHPAIELGRHQRTIEDYTEGRFDQLSDVHFLCRTMGYRIRGGFATCAVWEEERTIEARYWIGSGDPSYETYTGELLWIDETERPLPLGEVGPVALSEGLRMARSIYEARPHRLELRSS